MLLSYPLCWTSLLLLLPSSASKRCVLQHPATPQRSLATSTAQTSSFLWQPISRPPGRSVHPCLLRAVWLMLGFAKLPQGEKTTRCEVFKPPCEISQSYCTEWAVRLGACFVVAMWRDRVTYWSLLFVCLVEGGVLFVLLKSKIVWALRQWRQFICFPLSFQPCLWQWGGHTLHAFAHPAMLLAFVSFQLAQT